jgi:maltose-binding protein MalE
LWSSLRPVERELLQKKLNEFGKDYPQYRFQELFYSTEELRTNYIISSLAGKGPALIHGASDNIGPLSELKVIKPLESFFTESFLDGFITEPFSANTVFNGHLYQIADRVGNHLCLVYNKNLLKKPPNTFSELIDWWQTSSLYQNNKDDNYALAWNYTEPFFAVPFIGGFNGWILDKNNSPTLNTEAVVKASQFIYDLAHKYNVIPKECDYETANALFLDGKSAMIINGPWSWGTYIKSGMNIGLCRIPKIDETDKWPTPLVAPLGYMINVNLSGEKLNIVTELVRYLTSAGVQKEFALEFNIIPSRKTVLNDPELKENDLYLAALDQMEVGRAMPVITELRWIWDAMRPAYQGIFTGAYSAEEAAQEMQILAEKLIQENRE